MKTCETCMYCVPCMTPKGTYSVCLNADGRIYEVVGKDDTCNAWYEEEDDDLQGM